MRLEEVGRDVQPGRIELFCFYLPPRVSWEVSKAGQKAIGRRENSNAIHPSIGESNVRLFRRKQAIPPGHISWIFSMFIVNVSMQGTQQWAEFS